MKTRAVIPIRMDQANYTVFIFIYSNEPLAGKQLMLNIVQQNYVGYSLVKQQGMLESFEREYYDMIRAAFLKYRQVES